MTTEQSDATDGGRRLGSAEGDPAGQRAGTAGGPSTTATGAAIATGGAPGERAGAAAEPGAAEPSAATATGDAAAPSRSGRPAEGNGRDTSDAPEQTSATATTDGPEKASGAATTEGPETASGAATTAGPETASGTREGVASGKASGRQEEDGPEKTDGAEKTAGAKTADPAGKADSTGKGERAPADPWAAFGPAPDPVLTRPRRAVRTVGRFLIHEWTLATLVSLALAVLLTWPTLRYPLYTLPQDYWDPSLQSWQMAWSGHILLTDPAQLWHANTFYPDKWSFAFSDTLLGYAPAGMVGNGPEAAVLRYNIMFVLAHGLATVGAYALARQLGAGRIGAAVAGASYTYAPWLLAQAGHLHIVSNGGIPLALAMLARGHGWSLRYGYRPERRHAGWAYAGWLVAAWQLSLGFGIGLPFAYVLAGVVLVSAVVWFVRRRRVPVKRPFGVRLFVADLVGGALFAAVGGLLAVPYFKVAELHPNAARTIGDIAIYSPPASGFFIAPAESRVWGGLHEGARALLPWHPEMTLLPGFALYALAAGGLFFSVWRVRHRLLLLAGVLVTMALAMGTRFLGGRFTYVPLFEYLPGWNGLRTPGRMMLWTTLLLGLLAAGAVTAFAARVRELAAQRIPPWPGPWLRLATLLPLLLVIVEGLNSTPHPVVPQQPAVMRTVAGPMLVLPSSQNLDQPVMLWSTSRFQEMVNGGSGFTPDTLDQVREVTLAFPDQASIDYLRGLGVRNVVVLRDQLAGTPWERVVDNPVEGLGITREEVGDAIVYHLS